MWSDQLELLNEIWAMEGDWNLYVQSHSNDMIKNLCEVRFGWWNLTHHIILGLWSVGVGIFLYYKLLCLVCQGNIQLYLCLFMDGVIEIIKCNVGNQEAIQPTCWLLKWVKDEIQDWIWAAHFFVKFFVVSVWNFILHHNISGDGMWSLSSWKTFQLCCFVLG